MYEEEMQWLILTFALSVFFSSFALMLFPSSFVYFPSIFSSSFHLNPFYLLLIRALSLRDTKIRIELVLLALIFLEIPQIIDYVVLHFNHELTRDKSLQ